MKGVGKSDMKQGVKLSMPVVDNGRNFKIDDEPVLCISDVRKDLGLVAGKDNYYVDVSRG